MFELLINLLDRLLEYLRTKKRFEAQFFVDYVEPLYSEVSSTAHNYFDFFHTFQAVLHTKDWATSVATIKELRQELQLKRQELLATIESLRNALSDRASEPGDESSKRFALYQFLSAVHDLFYEEAFVDPGDRARFPSLTKIIDAEIEARRANPSGSVSAVPVHLYEFLALQDNLYGSSVEGQHRLIELQNYVGKTIDTLRANWHNTVLAYVRLRLLMQGADSILRKSLR